MTISFLLVKDRNRPREKQWSFIIWNLLRHTAAVQFNRQPPLGAHVPPALDALPFTKDAQADTFSSTLSSPHTGHFISWEASVFQTSLSKSVPQARHVYS
jgi:hypothetical protein